jgi:hypothetical protein
MATNVAAVDGDEGQLTDHDPDEHALEQPQGIRAALPEGCVEGDHRGDGREEGRIVAEQAFGDHPGHRRDDGLLEQRPRPGDEPPARPLPPGAPADVVRGCFGGHTWRTSSPLPREADRHPGDTVFSPVVR